MPIISLSQNEKGAILETFYDLRRFFMKCDNDLDPYQALANAIIVQACEDYRESYKNILSGHGTGEDESQIKDCLDFFESKWFEMYTKIDAGYVIKKLKEDVLDGMRVRYVASWKRIRIGDLDAVQDRRNILDFIRSGRLAELSDCGPEELINEMNEVALKEMIQEFKSVKKEYDAKKSNGTDASKEEHHLNGIVKFMFSCLFPEMTIIDPERLLQKM